MLDFFLFSNFPHRSSQNDPVEFSVTYSMVFKIILFVYLLVIEDLSLSEDSPHRTLATSISAIKDEGPPFANLNSRSMASSCPNLHDPHGPSWTPMTPNGRSQRDIPLQMSLQQRSMNLSSSLPNKLDTNCVFDSLTAANKNLLIPPVPSTPPPSVADDLERSTPVFDTSLGPNVWQTKREDNLVHVQIEEAINSNSRLVDVDFNTLDIIFNLKSWVMIFDFFGIGSPKVDSKTKSSGGVTIKRDELTLRQKT